MSGGGLFQRRLPTTGNALSPTWDSRVRRITSCEDDDDRTGGGFRAELQHNNAERFGTVLTWVDGK